jgi:hypothetical protein
MANLADLCNDKNRLAWAFDDQFKEFCAKYEISPFDVEIKWTGTGLQIVVKV